MNNSFPPEQPPAGSSLGVNDVVFILFRRKWIILAGLLLGAVAAGVVYKVNAPLYYSVGKLLVRYVTDAKGPDATSDPSEIVRSPELRGNAILNSEAEILASQDVLVSTALKTSPSKILAAYDGGTNQYQAARVLASSLEVTPGKNSAVIEVRLGHKDPEIAQTALRNLLREYLAKHVETHRAPGTFEFLQEQTEQIRFRLRDQEEELRKEKGKVNVISLSETKLDFSKWMSELQKQIAQAEADVAQQDARIAQFAPPAPAATDVGTSAATNGVTAVTNAPIAQRDLANYNSLVEKLTTLRSRKVELQSVYTETGVPMVQLQQQIKVVEKALQDLGIDPSTIVSASTSRNSGQAGASLLRPFDLETEKALAVSARARVNALKGQLEKGEQRLKELSGAEGTIVALERRKDLTEDLYTYFSKNLERARIDQTIDREKLNNIIIIEDATLAAQDSKKTLKLVAMAFAGCFGGALALAFCLELFLDPSVKRSKELELALKIPVFASIPDFGRNGHSKLKPAGGKGAAAALPGSILSNGEIPPWDDSDPMLPYYETIRDRLVMSYNGDMHKPKIVGLTSTNHGAGVSRISIGLAAALSRDVQRDVLLIALERGKVAISSFAKGLPASSSAPFSPNLPGEIPSIENSPATPSVTNDISELGPRPAELDRDLHSLTTTGRNTAGASIVQSFCDLMPRLKVSDYDYIIFDLPPINETSGALRLASQMERTILVPEARTSAKEKLKRASQLLQQNRANVFAVLNKVRHYGPKSLQDHN